MHIPAGMGGGSHWKLGPTSELEKEDRLLFQEGRKTKEKRRKKNGTGYFSRVKKLCHGPGGNRPLGKEGPSRSSRRHARGKPIAGRVDWVEVAYD